MHAFAPEDNIVATYRSTVTRCFAACHGLDHAEMYGRQEGCSRGRGGSMHLFDAKTRFFRRQRHRGWRAALAAGFALADHLRRSARVTACFFGDGAVAEGAFHESMNLAALWKLPVLFLLRKQPLRHGTALARYESQTDSSHNLKPANSIKS